MTKKMLIDATQADETRIVVLQNGEIEEIEFERSDRQQLKSNIYLARITRVEPSLQAAFVDFGGNRHGFLPFSEIHPDYYQIPVEDREALMQEADELFRKANDESEKQENAREERAAKGSAKSSDRRRKSSKSKDGDNVDNDDIEDAVIVADGAEAADGNAETAAREDDKPKKRVRRRRSKADDADKEPEGKEPTTVIADATTAEDEADTSTVEDAGQADPIEAAVAEALGESTPQADTAEQIVEHSDDVVAAKEEAVEAKVEVEVEAQADSDSNSDDENEDEPSDDAPKTMAASIESDDELVSEVSEEVVPAVATEDASQEAAPAAAGDSASDGAGDSDTAPAEGAASDEKPKRRTRRKKADDAEAATTDDEQKPKRKPRRKKADDAEAATETGEEKPKRARRARKPKAEDTADAEATDPIVVADDSADNEDVGLVVISDRELNASAEEAVNDDNADADAEDKPKRRSRGRSSATSSGRGRRRPSRNDDEDDAENDENDLDTQSRANNDHDDDDVYLDDNDSDAENDADSDAIDADNQRRAIMRTLLARRYKIQEVIKRRQIMLVQVVKEERGNKGAALTTYLSLAGRYCVLMPNTARGGGISRKIASAKDRKRLKNIVEDLSVPSGLSVIVRTAGSERSKPEIRRDYDYLIRTWNDIRNTTLESQAPSLIYEEGNIIKRCIRDIYSSDTDEVLVDGERGFKTAKALMKALTPSHVKKVKLHPANDTPLFVQSGVEDALEKLHDNIVQLPSGGYIVMNQTEALVAIDVNSGKAIKERHIEDTAVKTNLEAATVIAEQLRLRDLAGLVVIDFIDMEENRHNSQVERRFRDGLRKDRARIQVGRISNFGLLELSRQRLRPSVIESSRDVCPSCGGDGHVRSAAAVALGVLRQVDQKLSAAKQNNSLADAKSFMLKVNVDIAMAMLNRHRDALSRFEQQHDIKLNVLASSDFDRGAFTLMIEDDVHGLIEMFSSAEVETASAREENRSKRNRRGGRNRRNERDGADESNGNSGASTSASASADEDSGKSRSRTSGRSEAETEEDGDENGSSTAGSRRGRGGRGRRRGGRDKAGASESSSENPIEVIDEDGVENQDAEGNTITSPEASDSADEEERKKRRRRGKRGGRRRSKAEVEADNAAEAAEAAEAAAAVEAGAEAKTQASKDDESSTDQPAVTEVEAPEAEAEAEVAADEASAREVDPEETTPKETAPEEMVSEEAPVESETVAEAEAEPQASDAEPEAEAKPEAEPEVAAEGEPSPSKPRRKGWWSR